MPGTAQALTRLDVVDHLRSTDAAASSGPLRVGIEQEWHTYALADPARHLHPEEVLGAVEAGGPLPCGSRTTVEPGGQVEIATPAVAPWLDALRAVRVDGAAVRERLAAAGIASLAAGCDPFREPVRTLRQPRYDAMEAYFDRFGSAGRRMMCSSASIQVNVDSGEGAEPDRRWGLAHRLGPALAAAFACSPTPRHRSLRLANWFAMDATRTRPALATGELAADWVAYVLDARLMLVHDDDRCRPVEQPVRFADWVERGIDGRRPERADLAYHCTTLFPPVRPRGWLELRWFDALPAGLAEVATAAVVALLADPEQADAAELALADVGALWSEAAAQGPRHRGLARAAASLLCQAAGALDRLGAGDLAEAAADAAQRWPARGRCPADDLEDRLRAGDGPAELADPPEEVARWR